MGPHGARTVDDAVLSGFAPARDGDEEHDTERPQSRLARSPSDHRGSGRGACWRWPLPRMRPAAAADAVFTVANYLSRHGRRTPWSPRIGPSARASRRPFAPSSNASSRLRPTRVPNSSALRRSANLVESYKVRSERNSATDYVANLDFAFQAKGVRDLLRREGIPFTDEQAPDLTVIPVWRTGASAARDDAAWSNVWRASISSTR